MPKVMSFGSMSPSAFQSLYSKGGIAMKKKLILAITLLSALIIQLGLIGVSQAATISGLCITEPEFTDYNAMTLQNIRDFLTARGGFMKALFPDVAETGSEMVDAALEIYNAAQANKINPRVLLTILQKEKGAVTSVERLPDDDLRLLAGCGAPTTAKKQIHCMAEKLKQYFYDQLSQCNPTVGGWQVDVIKLAGDTPGQATDSFGETVPVEPRDKSVTVLPALSPDGRTSERSMQITQDILEQAGILKKRVPYSELVNNDFLPR